MSSTPNRAKIPGDRRHFIFQNNDVENRKKYKKNNELIKFTIYAKIKITKFPLLSKPCIINGFLGGFYLNYEELKLVKSFQPGAIVISFYLNYEELKLQNHKWMLHLLLSFYLNYEELKPTFTFCCQRYLYNVFILTMRN